MYNAARGSDELFQDLAEFAMLVNLFWKIVLNQKGKRSLTVGSREYDSFFEFIDNVKNKPETVSLLLQDYKREFLYGVADSNEKPESWTPEEYLYWFDKTFTFICDTDVLAYNEDTMVPFYNKYGTDIAFNRIDLILAECFNSLVEEDILVDYYKERFDSIKDLKSFKKACRDMLDLACVEKEKIKGYVELLVEDFNTTYPEIQKNKDIDITKEEFYTHIFDYYFNCLDITRSCMHNTNYMRYYDGQTDADIKKLGYPM